MDRPRGDLRRVQIAQPKHFAYYGFKDEANVATLPESDDKIKPDQDLNGSSSGRVRSVGKVFSFVPTYNRLVALHAGCAAPGDLGDTRKL